MNPVITEQFLVSSDTKDIPKGTHTTTTEETSTMSIKSAIAAIYAEKMITPQMEAFLNRTIKSRRLTYAEKCAMQELVSKVKSGEIILLSAQ